MFEIEELELLSRALVSHLVHLHETHTLSDKEKDTAINAAKSMTWKLTALESEAREQANKWKYPWVTIVMDETGCLHLWEGHVEPNNDRRYPKVNGCEATTFIQRQDDVKTLMVYLHEETRELLAKGWAIHSSSVPDDYMVHEF